MFFRRLVAVLVLTLAFGGLSVRMYAQTPQEITFDATHVLSFVDDYGTPVYEENDGKKHYLVAFTAALGTELIISSWNRFVARSGWAKVGWNDVKTFYKKDVDWDKDWYWTNFVLHPYQGGLTYMAARASNLNRIESLILTATGDAAWEWFFETNAPSKNDLVYSFVGAFVVGEMLYRLSLEADSIHRLFGYALNPERMWTEFWTKQRPRGTVGNIHELSVTFGLGATVAHTAVTSGRAVSHEYSDSFTSNEYFPVWGSPAFYVVYNDPYGHDSNNPFSQFELEMGFSLGVNGSGKGRGRSSIEEKMLYDIFIFSNGMLLSRAVDWGENRDTTVGFVFDYDFRWHTFMDLSTLSPGVAIKQRINYEKSRIEWQAHVDANILGTTDYYHFHRSDHVEDFGRDYSYNVGAEMVGMWKYATDSGWLASLDFHGYAMYDFADQKQDSDNSTGWEFIGIGDLRLELPVSERVRLGLSNEVYVKKAWYHSSADVAQIMYSGGVYAKLQVK